MTAETSDNTASEIPTATAVDHRLSALTGLASKVPCFISA
eukprot:CAMPEP_0172159862 /NCGR_PEP_ID=MMETSP1050-20130122/5227_1 /TAXON_ID=233186 /ORGANISM="Cryptomonas curvata, Strain CCAP979/52" /LENGTH=39 /DNA_ID= /DNA_START= /DNA_END= /DNA_ORIENTATION=